MWEVPTESRNPTPWGTRGNKDQTENHSTKCDTKKRPKEPKRNERERKGKRDGKEKTETKHPWALDQVKGYCGGTGASGLAMTINYLDP